MFLKTHASMSTLIRTGSLVLAFGLSGSVYAQPAGPGEPGDTPAGGTSRPGDLTPAATQPGIPAEAPLELPADALPKKKTKTPYGAKIHVEEVRLTGNTVFSAEVLQEIITPYENRTITSSELEDLRVELTRYYINRGYINSGAVLPDQKVTDGIVNIVIVEGTLVDIEIVGNEHLSSDYIDSRLKLGAKAPLNVNDLQQQIQIILESPVIETINSALRPGDRPGEASLTALVKEAPRLQYVQVVDNRLSPTLGEVRVLPQLYVNDLTGQGDALSTGVSLGEGLTDAYANWSIPLNANDTTLSLLANRSDSQVENGPFKDLDIKSKAQTYGFRVSHPFYRTPKQKFSMALGLDVRKTESELLGVGFAFTLGVPTDGIVRASVIRFSQEWSDHESNQVLAARSQFSFGIDAFDATINANNDPSGEFAAWLGQFQWARRFDDNWGQLIFRTNVQLTNDSLLSMEQFSVGGALSVRGYRENQLVRDKGYIASIEYRYPLMTDATGRSVFALAPFIDVGGADNNTLSNGPNPDSINSAGLGLRWDPTSKVHAQLYWGHAFKDVVKDFDSLQDDGFHFFISANLIEWL
jgi:hemolysin activation/secretion protein